MDTLLTLLDWFFKVAGVLGVIWLAVVFSSRLLAKFWADSMLETKKAELQKTVEKHKADLGVETEKLKGELSKDTESHKFVLRKRELLFNKEIEAATAYFKLYAKLEPRYTHPDKDWGEVLDEVVRDFADMEDKLSNYLAIHGVFLSSENRADLEECEQAASSHQYTTHSAGGYTMKQSTEEAERILAKLRVVRNRFVDELRG